MGLLLGFWRVAQEPWRPLSLPGNCGPASGLLARALVFSKEFPPGFHFYLLLTAGEQVFVGLRLGAWCRNLDGHYCSPWQFVPATGLLARGAGALAATASLPGNCGPASGLLV